MFKTSLTEKILYGFNGKDTCFVTGSVVSLFLTFNLSLSFFFF